MYVRVCVNCVYLFIVFFLECVGVLPFDGEIKMYIYNIKCVRYKLCSALYSASALAKMKTELTVTCSGSNDVEVGLKICKYGQSKVVTSPLVQPA